VQSWCIHKRSFSIFYGIFASTWDLPGAINSQRRTKGGPTRDAWTETFLEKGSRQACLGAFRNYSVVRGGSGASLRLSARPNSPTSRKGNNHTGMCTRSDILQRSPGAASGPVLPRGSRCFHASPLATPWALSTEPWLRPPGRPGWPGGSSRSRGPLSALGLLPGSPVGRMAGEKWELREGGIEAGCEFRRMFILYVCRRGDHDGCWELRSFTPLGPKNSSSVASGARGCLDQGGCDVRETSEQHTHRRHPPTTPLANTTHPQPLLSTPPNPTHSIRHPTGETAYGLKRMRFPRFRRSGFGAWQEDCSLLARPTRISFPRATASASRESSLASRALALERALFRASDSSSACLPRSWMRKTRFCWLMTDGPTYLTRTSSEKKPNTKTSIAELLLICFGADEQQRPNVLKKHTTLALMCACHTQSQKMCQCDIFSSSCPSVYASPSCVLTWGSDRCEENTPLIVCAEGRPGLYPKLLLSSPARILH